MSKTKILPRNVIEALRAERAKADTVEASISKRIDYVIHFIFDTFNLGLRSWDYSGDDEYNTLDNCLGIYWDKNAEIDDTIDFHPLLKNNKNYNPYEHEIDFDIIIGNNEYNLLYNFPSRWLFEDFEEELVEAIENGKELRKKKATEEKKQQEENQATLKAAKSKLTKAELDALKGEK